MALPGFTATGNLNQILGDLAGGSLAETAMATAQIRFTSSINPDSFVEWDNRLHRILPVDAVADSNGDIQLANPSGGVQLDDDGDPVAVVLLANDDGLNVSDIRWTVLINVHAPTPSVAGDVMRSWEIGARSDGETVDIKDDMPPPGQKKSRGVAAPPVTGGSFDADEDGNNTLVLESRDGTTTTPILIPEGVLVVIDNGDGTVSIG